MWLLYKKMRKEYGIVWFYFIPFIALSLNFLVPYFVALSNKASEVGMDDAYLEWLE